MAPYSMDLRKRVLRAWDAGVDAESVAAFYDCSRAVARVDGRKRICSRRARRFRYQAV